MNSRFRPNRSRSLTNLRVALNEVAAPAVEESSRPIVPIRLAWQQLCGSALASHTEPTQLHKGRLTISADSIEWANAIDEVYEKLLAELRQVFPLIEDITVIVEHSSAGTIARPKAASHPPPDPSNADIEHPGLRAACDGLAALRRQDTVTPNESKS